MGRDRQRSDEAENLLRQSLNFRGLADTAGQAKVLHTLGQLIGRDRQRSGEAENLLRQSLAIGEQTSNKRHQAQILYSLGRLLESDVQDEALNLFQRSLALNRDIGDTFHAERLEKQIAILRRKI
ncbi:tetratricopeptide repeat protein [Amycolatopsis solani]|uniref:tetratricopeptide repeat protein n=1 Tax=Amycolatopsis solani TaxID=3028615 RepID=UPI00339D635A